MCLTSVSDTVTVEHSHLNWCIKIVVSVIVVIMQVTLQRLVQKLVSWYLITANSLSVNFDRSHSSHQQWR